MSSTHQFPGLDRVITLTAESDPDHFERRDNDSFPIDGSRIEEKTGIKSRNIAREGQTIESLGEQAGHRLLEQITLDVRDAGGLVLATCYPGNKKKMAKNIAKHLGITGEVRGADHACAGGIAAVELAADISQQTGKPVIGMTVEKLSDMVNWEAAHSKLFGKDDPRAIGKSASIFGDGAAAFFVKPPGYPSTFEILHANTYPVPNQHDKIVLVPVKNSIDVHGKERPRETNCINMPGKAGFELMKLGPITMIEGVRSMLYACIEKNVLDEMRIPEHHVFHQANGNMLNRLEAQCIEMYKNEIANAPEQIDTIVWNRIATIGNVSAASIMYPLVEVQDKAEQGDLVAASVVGAGSPGFKTDKLEAGAMLLRKTEDDKNLLVL